jgi:hypothetical protein
MTRLLHRQKPGLFLTTLLFGELLFDGLLFVVRPRSSYGGRVGVQQLEPTSWTTAVPPSGDVKHGYPPPRLAPGEITTSYCGEPMIVEGAVSDRPPRDACPLCVRAWREHHRL